MYEFFIPSISSLSTFTLWTKTECSDRIQWTAKNNNEWLPFATAATLKLKPL